MLAADIARAFDFDAPIVRVSPFGRGRINDTFLIDLASGTPRRLLLQRVNTRVFPAPERIMRNIRRLTRHLDARQAELGPGQPRLRLPTVVPARDGRDWWRDDDGGFWRMLGFIEESHTLVRVDTPQQAAQCGWALGRFHRLTWDLPCAELHETLPGFHVLPGYLEHFERVLSAWSGPVNAELASALAAVEQRRNGADVLERARRQGRLPLRPIHGDPKLDNILFRQGGESEPDQALGLVDLDTIQPGLQHYDLGDCLRSVCNPAGESAPAPRWEPDLCRALLLTYLTEMRGHFGAEDYHLVYDCARLLPFELGLRFLTDHLEGDRYFKLQRRGQNLERALTQFRLTALIERQEGQIRKLARDPGPF